jgi:CheY-like chemotaxis protein
MEDVATLDRQAHRVRLLIADDDRAARALLASCVRDAVGEIVVLEAEDGGEAIQLGLQGDPQVALLGIDLPRLGGLEAAITLRELKPRIRVALHGEGRPGHRARACGYGLPLFSKLELDRILLWLRAEVQWWVEELASGLPKKRDFVCRACGYGAFRSGAPERCPMCQAESAWVEIPRHSASLAAQ